MANKKLFGCNGQVVMFDLMFAFFLFLVLFGFAFSMWNQQLEKTLSEKEFAEYGFYANLAADSLARTPGYPIDWDNADANFFGLASKPLVLDSQKVDSFFSLSPNNYFAVRQKLGVPKGLFVRLYGEGLDRNFGAVPEGKIFGVTRTVLLEEKEAFLEVKVFQ